jgi:hypothetical protein
MRLEWLMNLVKQLRPRAAHILIVERDDGHTYLASTFSADNALYRLNGAGLLTHRWLAIDTPHAEDIVAAVAKDFAPARLDAFGPWYLADYDEMLRTLQDFDALTGKRLRDARFEVGARVQVTGAGRGHIKAFRGPMLVVKLDSPRGSCSEVITSKSLVKPVLRVIATRELPGAA